MNNKRKRAAVKSVNNCTNTIFRQVENTTLKKSRNFSEVHFKGLCTVGCNKPQQCECL